MRPSRPAHGPDTDQSPNHQRREYGGSPRHRAVEKRRVLAANDPSQTPSSALRPRIITVARAIPAAGKTGETLPGGIVTRKPALAANGRRAVTAKMAAGAE